MKRPPDCRRRIPAHVLDVLAALALVTTVAVSTPAVAGGDDGSRVHDDSAAGDVTLGTRAPERPGIVTGPGVLTPETIEACLEVAQAIDVKLGARLRELRETKPDDFVRRLKRMRRLLEMVELRRRDPNQYQLELLDMRVDANVIRLAGELRHVPGGRDSAEAESIAGRLRVELRVQIALDHKAREEYVCRIRELVTRLEEELDTEKERLKADFNRIVEERLEALAAGPETEGEATADRPGGLAAVPTAGDMIPAGSGIDAATGAWGDRMPGRPGRGLPEALTSEMVEEYMLVAREIDTELAVRLEAVRKKNPDELAARLRRMRRLNDFVELKRRDPSLYRLKLVELHVDEDVSRLAAGLREARGSGRTIEAEALEQQILGQLRLQLAFEFQAQAAYVDRLRDLVTRLEEEQLHARERLVERPDEVIEERLEELVGGARSESGAPRHKHAE